MTRKEWLEKFFELADSGAKTIAYRRHLRIKPQHIRRHVVAMPSYRAELAALVEEERKEKEEATKLAAQRVEKVKKVAKKIKQSSPARLHTETKKESNLPNEEG